MLNPAILSWRVGIFVFAAVQNLMLESLPGGHVQLPLSIVYEGCDSPGRVKEHEGSCAAEEFGECNEFAGENKFDIWHYLRFSVKACVLIYPEPDVIFLQGLAN